MLCLSRLWLVCATLGEVTGPPARLKVLLRERHWQTYQTFQREYDRAARSVDPALVRKWPSRAQFGRWLSGDLKGLPYPDHCRVLEKMFPGWTAEQLFEPCPQENPGSPESARADGNRLVQVIEERLDNPHTDDADWGPPTRAASSVAPLVLALSGSDAGESPSSGQLLGRRLLELKQLQRLADDETDQLAGLAGCVVELDKTLDLYIAADGAVILRYDFELLNLGTKPLTRVTRELWFQEMSGPLAITPAPDGERRVTIDRIHDTANLSKFAFQISPPLQSGESARVGYSCSNGLFGVNHYWREEMARYTRRYTLRVRQENVRLASCAALEEYPDGSESSANDSLIWDYKDDGVVLTLTRDYLRPKQSVTLRWEVIRDSS